MCRNRLVLAAFVGLAACASVPQQRARSQDPSSRRIATDFGEFHPPLDTGPRWKRGEVAMQGFVGAGYLDDVTLRQGGTDLEIDAGELDNFPVLGGGGQWKLWGERVDIGLEALFSFGWKTNSAAFASGGGGGALAVDVDTLLVDVGGGPFVSVFLGDDFRIYTAAGPLLQFVDYTQEDSASGIAEGSTGFGAGIYARAGFEFRLPNECFLGLGARHARSDADLGSEFGEFDVDSTQVFVSVTSWM